MTLAEKAGERLARRMHRRQFINRVAAAAFGAVAAWSVEGIRGHSALAHHCSVTSNSCGCTPPVVGDRRYCTQWSASYCSGATCSGGCTPAYAPALSGGYLPSTGGCWCTLDCCSGGNKGHWKCCDCWCQHQGQTKACGCRAYVVTQIGGCPTLVASEA